jgi:NADH-quinone oxidoreductase subunit E
MFSAETLQKFAREVTKYPAIQKQSAVMACLAHAQEEKGWLPPDAIESVAFISTCRLWQHLRLPLSTTCMISSRSVRYKITVCTNLPCALSGGYHAGEYIQKKLGIGYGETTADGKFTLKEGECMGACGDAPVLIVNNRTMCSHMHPEQIDKLLEECK